MKRFLSALSLAIAKRQPGALYYGSAGNRSAGHLAFEYLKLVTQISVQHVPYKGTGPNLVDLVAGRVIAVAEQGYRGFETSQWYGLNAPAKTPPEYAEYIAKEQARWKGVIQKAKIKVD